MTPRRLLFLLCVSVLFLSVVHLTRAGSNLIVNESRTRFVLQKDHIDILFAVENTTGQTRNASIRLELLDTKDAILSETSETQTVAPGIQILRFKMPQVVANLTDLERRDLLWYRLRYRLVETVGSSMLIQNGIISLSEIMPDLFELRVAAADFAREGGSYRARVQARHPFTHSPAPGVQIKGTFTFDENENIKREATATTGKDGYALLNFVMPPALAGSSHGEIRVVGTRDGVVAEAKGDMPVDSLVRTLITTDKTFYQPGQVMHVRAVVFGAMKRALANQNMVFRIVDPEGVNVFVSTAVTSRFGVVNADWQIPDNVRLGDYRIWVDLEGETHQRHFDVRISRYDLPNFTVNVEPDRGYYLPGQNAKVKVRADYLFGQPVKHGRVRLVEETLREWNFREQKWTTEEGDEYEGETNAQGVFEANVDLASEHEEIDSWYQQFKDLTFGAYFTDPTTNRTEQRRFTLRLTKEAIHVYIITRAADTYQSRNLPLQVYFSTYYADGSPARCKLDVSLANMEEVDPEDEDLVIKRQPTIRTNRYGLAKTSLRVSREFADRRSLWMKVSATGSNGRSGTAQEHLYLDDDTRVFVNTDKSLYRAGDPIVASITSDLPDQTLIVDLANESSVIRSERVRLRGGRATITYPYEANYKGRMTVVAYPDFADESRHVGVSFVLYPSNPELNLNIKTSQAIYRPGDDASVRLNVRTADGSAAASALGVVVSDKAVDERMRTDAEFGGRSQPYNQTVMEFMGLSQQLSGITLRDLQRLDMRKSVTPELDLLAEILLHHYGGYFPSFYGGGEYETELAKVFGPLIDQKVKPLYYVLHEHHTHTGQYPRDEKTLREYLLMAGRDLDQISDPWGMPYRPIFTIEGRMDVFTLMCGGADKRFGTDDDFSVLRMNWEYFTPLGKTIQGAVESYHKRTGGFIRDLETLRQELARAGLSLDQLRDRWGQPYRFHFAVNEINYVIEVNSGGPDRRFSREPGETDDDFTIWRAQIDYFAELRQQIEKTLNDQLESSKTFPQSDVELREALRGSAHPLETLRDPWNRSYYPVFKTQSFYADRVQIENRSTFGNPATSQTSILPVTRTTASVTLKSSGLDGQEGTYDDFAVATFSRVIREEARGATLAPVAVVLSVASGAIHGVITDPNGAMVATAKVTVTQTPDVRRYHSSSNDEGVYLIKDLPPGLYEVRVEAPGFVTAVISNVQVRVSSFTQVNVMLQPGAVTESVTVTAASPELNMTTALVSSSITQRSVRDLALTIPGTTSAQISTPRLREYFPETLVWQPSVETDKHGRAEVKFKLADNITTWKMAVIGSTEDGRIGTAETEFKAFQPFFVDHDPPRVLTEGDEISLPVVVRNYLDRVQKVDLEIKPEPWFSLTGPARKQTSVAAGDAARQIFDFRTVSSVRDGPQRITALGNDANDAIEKPVSVHPDGEELSDTAGDLLSTSASLDLNLPETVIPRSTHAELKIYPNLMAHVVESVEAIMKRPYGCGEQTISSTYPSLLLLRNYKHIGEDFPLRTRAQRYLNIGYTRLLSYRDESGGFAYWSNSNPDIALTAYALNFLTDAADVMEVDRDIIREARQWLIKQQGSDGSWAPHQFAVTTDTEIRKRALVTAYVARVLTATETRLVSATSESAAAQERAVLAASLRRAVDFVEKRSSEIDEPYLLASYALILIEIGARNSAKPLIEKLRSLAHKEGVSAYWSLETNTPFYGWGIAGRVETTALAVQALSRHCALQGANCDEYSELTKQGLLFLFKSKDEYGVWYSTQATINVLNTMLSVFASNKVGQDSGAGSSAQIEINGRVVQTVTIPETRRAVTPITIPITSFLSAGYNRIAIKRPGGGAFSSVQAQANYYVPWENTPQSKASPDLRLSAKFDKTEAQVGDAITCHVELERVGFRGYGMLLVEIGLPPGVEVDRNLLETARKDWTIMQYDVLPDRLVLYVWPHGGPVKLDFQFRPRFGMTAKSAPSVVYDYYNPESRVVLAPVKFRVK